MLESVAEKERAVRGVLKSRTFARSPRLRETLAFIWDSQKAGRHISQKDIAMEIYGFDGDDMEESLSRARRIVTELRRRVIEYEAVEQCNRHFSIRIPVGAYRLEFRNSGSETPRESLSCSGTAPGKRPGNRGRAVERHEAADCPFLGVFRALCDLAQHRPAAGGGTAGPPVRTEQAAPFSFHACAGNSFLRELANRLFGGSEDRQEKPAVKKRLPKPSKRK